ncbi:MAG TPA: MmcQ/YjbR family DNA-binding protein [Bryobacteraceae bacterium]|nr:MmcQ/YjbR family DNA-binding protein [Bryobacteraceae bacterium]
MKKSHAEILKRLRSACARIPDSSETVTFGHPAFQVSGKTYAVLEEYKGELSICVRVEKSVQDVFLDDARFYRTPYIGKHGWVSLKVYAAPLDWDEIAQLLAGSRELVAAQGRRRR